MDREGERAKAGIGADVARRLLAPNVLLAGRQRQHEAAAALGVDRFAGEPSRHLPHELEPGREQPDIGAAEIERVADRLAFADDDVGVHLARRAQRAERHRLGEHRDQQRALGVRGGGDRREVARIAEEVRALHDDAARLVVDRGGDVLAAPRGSGGSRTIVVARHVAPASRRRRHIADAGRRTAPPCRAGSAGAPSASPRRRRSSRRTSRRWRPPCRSAPRPGSGTRTGPAACPGRFPADRACSWSGIPSAGSDDRRSPAHGGDRRRRRGRTAPTPPRRCARPSRRASARPPISLLRAAACRAGRVEPLVGGNVGEQRVDVGDADPRQHRRAGRPRRAADSASAQAMRLEKFGVGGFVHQRVELRSGRRA